MLFISNYMLLNQYYCSEFWSKKGISTLRNFLCSKLCLKDLKESFRMGIEREIYLIPNVLATKSPKCAWILCKLLLIIVLQLLPRTENFSKTKTEQPN